MDEQTVPMFIPKVTQLVGLDNPFPQNKPKSHFDLTQELFSRREKKSQRGLCYAFGNNFKVGELKGLEIIECDLCVTKDITQFVLMTYILMKKTHIYVYKS